VELIGLIINVTNKNTVGLRLKTFNYRLRNKRHVKPQFCSAYAINSNTRHCSACRIHSYFPPYKRVGEVAARSRRITSLSCRNLFGQYNVLVSHIHIPKGSRFLGYYCLSTGEWLPTLPGKVGNYLPVDTTLHPNFIFT